MSNSKVPSGEMPVLFDRFRQYDADGSGGLGSREIETMTPEDISALFAYGVSEGRGSHQERDQVSFEQAGDVLARLRPDIRTSVLRGLNRFSFDPSLQGHYVTNLANRDLQRTVDDIARGYQADDSRGLTGHLLLRDLDPQVRQQILGGLRVGYPDYVVAITQWDQIPNTPSSPTHRNVVEAIRSATIGKDTRIYGFGEQHLHLHDDMTLAPTTLERFGREIVPYLVREKGVSVIAVEYLSATMDEEIEFYMDFGVIEPRFTPELDYLITHRQDAAGLLATLESVRQLRREGYYVELRGLMPDRIERLIAASVTPDEMIAGINDNCRRVVDQTLNEGRKIALYTGAMHNDIPTPADQDSISYVPLLNNHGDHFLALDLFVPQYYVGGRNAGPDGFVHRAPMTGVILQGEGNTYTLVFGRSHNLGTK